MDEKPRPDRHTQFTRYSESLRPMIEALGKSLRHQRESKHFSLREVNRKVGVSDSEIWKVEVGVQDCRATTLIKLARFYCISLDELLADLP
jgi:transcriptional regulator with XRE-family HTH domain